MPEEQHGTQVSLDGNQDERNLSAFGTYIQVMCSYLRISRRQLALRANLKPHSVTEVVTHPEREPATETVNSLIVAIETIARERNRPLPHGWQLEFALSARSRCADGLLYLAYFRGQTLHEDELARIEKLIFSMQTTANIVRGRSRSDK